MSEESLTTKMRKATREVHSISDSLVNAKLAVALSDDKVWAEGLLIFYEIFRFLEEALDRHRGTIVSQLDIEGLRRTEAFEKDLSFYLGKDWKSNYVVRESVAVYLLHLKNVESSNPNLLLAYIYHLYMGLLSGGQILRYKRKMFGKFPFSSATQEGGNAVTDFGDIQILQLKREMKAAMNSVAEDLDETTKQMLIEESKTVFIKNNEIIRTVKGGTLAFIIKLIIIIAPLIVALMLCQLLLFYNN